MTAHASTRLARALITAFALFSAILPTPASAQSGTARVLTPSSDPRVGLRAGYHDAGEAARNLSLIAHRDRADGFFDPNDMGAFAFANSDMAFQRNYLFQGGYHGFQIWNVANPANPVLTLANPCAGGQGDVSVYRNLLFVSVEQTSGRLDCGLQGVTDTVSKDRIRGVRIFDITDINHPKQVADIQTCRGSHTHTLVIDPKDHANVYIYVSGTSVPRPAEELAGCSALEPEQDPNTSLYRIDVIQVPLAAPQNARIVSNPRVFADPSGAIAGLQKGDSLDKEHKHAASSRCHDITVYSAISLAAGACAGNGIILDISDPVHPRRIAEVSDPNFSFWHSATFNNAGTTVIFTDEWGGGTLPKCRVTDDPHWGADALFTLRGRRLTPASYFKLPAAQTDKENCVAHNGSLIPVPGRDIFVQAWYQGGVSVMDFTDAAHPKEIAFFDRGPLAADSLYLAGYWSAYWYNGHIYGSEIARGLDVFDLQPSEFLTQNEIDAARSVHLDEFNPQNQQRIVWPATFAVPRAYLDQLNRGRGVSAAVASRIARDLDRAESLTGRARRAALTALAARLDGDARRAADNARVRALATSVRSLAKAL